METQTRAPGSRTARVRWVGAGLLDQVVIASANAGTTLLGLILLDRGPAGLMVLALGIGYCAMHLNRAFVGDVLVALSSRYDDERRDSPATAWRPRCWSGRPRAPSSPAFGRSGLSAPRWTYGI